MKKLSLKTRGKVLHRIAPPLPPPWALRPRCEQLSREEARENAERNVKEVVQTYFNYFNDDPFCKDLFQLSAVALLVYNNFVGAKNKKPTRYCCVPIPVWEFGKRHGFAGGDPAVLSTIVEKMMLPVLRFYWAEANCYYEYKLWDISWHSFKETVHPGWVWINWDLVFWQFLPLGVESLGDIADDVAVCKKWKLKDWEKCSQRGVEIVYRYIEGGEFPRGSLPVEYRIGG